MNMNNCGCIHFCPTKWIIGMSPTDILVCVWTWLLVCILVMRAVCVSPRVPMHWTWFPVSALLPLQMQRRRKNDNNDTATRTAPVFMVCYTVILCQTKRNRVICVHMSHPSVHHCGPTEVCIGLLVQFCTVGGATKNRRQRMDICYVVCTRARLSKS